MSRYATAEWKELEVIQNELAEHADIDILTITGFMTDDQLKQHVIECRNKLTRYAAKAA